MTLSPTTKTRTIANGNDNDAEPVEANFVDLYANDDAIAAVVNSLTDSAISLSGIKTFSDGIKTDTVSEKTAGSGVTADSVLLKDGFIKLTPTTQPYVPAADGEFGYDSTNKVYKGMMDGVIVPFGNFLYTVSSKSANYTALGTDKGTQFLCTGTFTLSLTAAATLGSGWFCYIRNDGTGIITIDPNASETVDGATTITMYPGEAFLVFCDGTNFKTLERKKGRILLGTAEASASTFVDFTNFINSDFSQYILQGDYVRPATDGVNAYVRFSIDGGSNFLSTGHTYQLADFIGSTQTGVATTEVRLNRVTIGNADGEGINFEFTLVKPSGGQAIKSGRWVTDWRNTSTGLEAANGSFNSPTASAINAIRFLFSSGNIAQGSFKLFGVRS